MKPFFFFSVFFSFISLNTLAQFTWGLDFDDTTMLSRVAMDTASNTNCIWQIGHPTKVVFDSTYTSPNAIVTDTLNSYPSNDTSRFTITHFRAPNLGNNEVLLLDFYFKMNSDTLIDYGLVEASLDDGATWINLLTEDTTYQLHWFKPKPVWSGNSNGWIHYSEDISPLTYEIGWSPTVLYRFTFISDSIQTNKDGWMLDHFVFEDAWEGIQEVNNSHVISINPNPTSSTIQLHLPSNHSTTLTLFNLLGKKVKEQTITGSDITIDVSELPAGMYVVRVEGWSGKFVKE